MKLITAIIASAAFVAAVEATAQERASCAEIGALAETVMDARQNNMPMSKLMEMATEEGLRTIVKMAYEEPAYSTDSYQRRAEKQFANKIMRICYSQE